MLAVLRQSRPFDEVVAVVGPGAELGGDWGGDRSWLRVVEGIDRFAATVDTGNAALSAAGTTTWEMLCMGMPTALVQVADNQAVVASGVDQTGAAMVLGPTNEALDRLPGALRRLADPLHQEELSRRALAYVDGQGATRVLDEALSLREERFGGSR
jgi:spore coat polysaccharide biosynthesis predicted glycosyltransferase SpsG